MSGADEHAERARDEAREHRVDHESRFGESPTSIADDLVLRGGARRETEARPAIQRRQRRGDEITIPARMKRSIGTTPPKIVTVSTGRIEGAVFGFAEDEQHRRPAATSRRPSEAASLASGEACRSGRKTSSSISDAEHRHARRS